MITTQQLKAGMPFAKLYNIDKYVMPLNDAMELFEINTFNRQCAFLAQLAHESGSLRYSKEIASGEAYEGRKYLGNIHPGDGKKYKGRAPIQITGRVNYQSLTDYFKIDFVNNPELLEQPIYGCAASGWFWMAKKLNRLADIGDTPSFYAITKRINGGLTGIEERLLFWERFKKALV